MSKIPPLEVCENGHNPVAYNGPYCPACELKEELDSASETIDTLEGENQNLQEELDTI